MLVSPDGVAPSWMVGVSVSVIFPCPIKSRSSLLAPAHPGGLGKSAVKRLWCGGGRRGRLYSSCVQSGMLHGSETWPVRKENEVALLRAGMRMGCDIKVKDRVPSKELGERLGIDDIILVLSKTGCIGMGMCCEKKSPIG